MSLHRFADQLNHPQPASSQQVARMSCAAFVVCPLAMTVPNQGRTWQHQVYEQAYREAQAVVQPSILERLSWGTNN